MVLSSAYWQIGTSFPPGKGTPLIYVECQIAKAKSSTDYTYKRWLRGQLNRDNITGKVGNPPGNVLVSDSEREPEQTQLP